MKNSRKLLIFTKNLIPGTVKTRISVVKGDQIALKVYQKLLEYTNQITKEIDCDKIVFFNNYIEKNGIWDDSIFEKKMQAPGNLGMKMATAFENELNNNCKVLLIGSDCPNLNKEIVEEAFNALENHDVVIGPAEDGGYYLIGMKKFQSFIFDGMPWSENDLFDKTIKKLQQNKQKTYILDAKSDVDFWEDFEKLGWKL